VHAHRRALTHTSKRAARQIANCVSPVEAPERCLMNNVFDFNS